MAANAKNRELARDELVSLIDTEMVGAGKPLQAVFGQKTTDFQNKAPVCVVFAGGSQRIWRGMGSGTAKYRTRVRLHAMFFVPDADEAAGWSDADVEDKLDEIEKEFADVIADNRGTGTNWTSIEHAPGEFSNIVPATVGGKAYVVEGVDVIVDMRD